MDLYKIKMLVTPWLLRNVLIQVTTIPISSTLPIMNVVSAHRELRAVF